MSDLTTLTFPDAPTVAERQLALFIFPLTQQVAHSLAAETRPWVKFRQYPLCNYRDVIASKLLTARAAPSAPSAAHSAVARRQLKSHRGIVDRRLWFAVHSRRPSPCFVMNSERLPCGTVWPNWRFSLRITYVGSF